MAFTINGTSGLTFPNATQQTTASFNGANTNAVSSSAITLTSSSPQYQVAQISSFTNSYITLPDATQVGLGSNPYVIENRSPYGAKLEIRNNAGAVVGFIPIGQIATVQLKDASTAAGQWAVELTVPQTFFTFNTASITSTTTTPLPTTTYAQGLVGLTSTTFVRWWIVCTNGGGTGSYALYTQVGVISGSTISFGSIQSSTILSGLLQNGGQGASARAIRLSNTAFVIYAGAYWSYSDACGSGNYGAQRINVCTVSGTVVTFGTWNAASFPTVPAGAFYNQSLAVAFNGNVCRLSDTSFALFYNDGTTNSYSWPNNYSGSTACQIVTVSGVTMTIGTKVALGTSTYSQTLSAVGLSSTSAFLCYAQATATGGSTGRTKIVVVSVSGTVPTFGTPVSCEASDVSCFNNTYANNNNVSDGAVAPSATQVIFNGGYAIGEATISGTVPTFDSFPYTTAPVYPLFLSTSSKAYSQNYYGQYFTVATGGFVTNTPVTQVLQTNASVQTAVLGSPLGAQPTTAFIAYRYGSDASSPTSTVIIGSTT